MDSHCDSVHGDAIGLKSYFTDAELWHLHLSIFLADKQCVVQTEEMSVVETEQMSAVETGQMSAAKTGQMSSAETGQMSVESSPNLAEQM